MTHRSLWFRSASIAAGRWARRVQVVALLVLAAGVPAALGASDLAAVKGRGKLVLVSYPLVDGPFVSVDVEAMRRQGLQLKDLRDPAAFRGIDVELIKGFAASLGLALEVHPVTDGYGQLIPALIKGEGDLVASSFSITPQRQETVDFSDPYVTGWISVAVQPQSRIASLEDLRGKRVAVMQGSSQLERVQALNLDLTIVLTDFALQNYVAVTEGRADFTLMDSYAPQGERVSAFYSELKVAFHLSEFQYGVALRKGSDLRAPLNAYLERLRQSGELQRLIDLYEPGARASLPAKQP